MGENRKCIIFKVCVCVRPPCMLWMLSGRQTFVFVCMCVLASVVCVCDWCVCRQASSRAPLGDGLIQQGSTSKRQTAASASASLTLT